MNDVYRADGDRQQLRVLFCIGVQSAFFDRPASELDDIGKAIVGAFADLRERFGITVLGTMDDDELMVGPSSSWPWTCYILADAPDLESVTAVCNVLRTEQIGGARLWKYLRIEARVGRPLFF